MFEKYLEKSHPKKKYVLVCYFVLMSIGISFSQKQFDKNKSWRIILKDKTDKLDRILTDTFSIDIKTNISQEVITRRYTSDGYIGGLEKRLGLSYTISIYNNFYKKKIIQNVEKYFYKPIIVKMKPLYVKANVAIKDVTQKVQNDYRIFKMDSFTVKKSKFPIKYPISSFLDTSLWSAIDNSDILKLKETEKKSNKNILLSFNIHVDRISRLRDFTIRINQSISSRPPTMYYDRVGFDVYDSKFKEKVPKDKLKFRAKFPDNPLGSEKIRLLFYNSKNFYFSNTNSQIPKPWISDVCTLDINTSDREYSINLNQLPNFNFLYISSYKLVKRMKWYEYLNSILKDIKGDDYFIYFSNNTTPVYYDNTQQFQLILQKILENEYDPPDINHDLKKISSIIKFNELVPQRRVITFYFFFTNFINEKTVEGIILPIIQKLGPEMQYVKMNIFYSDKKDLEFLKYLDENERKNVFVKNL